MGTVGKLFLDDQSTRHINKGQRSTLILYNNPYHILTISADWLAMAGIGPVPTPASRTSNRAGVRSESRRPATRSLSRITEDDSHDDSDNDDNTTPRQATNPRRTSFASTSRLTRRSKSRTAVSTTEPGSNQVTPRVKRLKLRPSLAGPQVHEMNIETRAQVLIPIAEDCIVQLLKAGLNGSIYRRNANETWRSAWASLQCTSRFSVRLLQNSPASKQIIFSRLASIQRL